MGVYDLSKTELNGTKYPSLDEGRYVVEIDKIVYLQARKGYPATIAEFDVIESSNPEHPAGVRRSYFQKMNVEAALGAILAFGCALAGIDTRDAQRVKAEKKNVEEFMNLAIGSDNPCHGIRVGVRVVPTPLRDQPDKTFPKHEWFPVDQPA